jgi:hypothetical protein
MSTITSNKFQGFTITAANRIVANFTLSVGEQPDGPTGGTPFVFTVTFPRNAARPPKMMIGSLSRDLPGGGAEFTSIAVSAPTGDVQVPLGVFSGRSVVWSVKDSFPNRVLMVTISSLDSMGTNEVWHQNLQITVAPTDETNFDVAILSGVGSVTSVDVTP